MNVEVGFITESIYNKSYTEKMIASKSSCHKCVILHIGFTLAKCTHIYQKWPLSWQDEPK